MPFISFKTIFPRASPVKESSQTAGSFSFVFDSEIQRNSSMVSSSYSSFFDFHQIQCFLTAHFIDECHKIFSYARFLKRKKMNEQSQFYKHQSQNISVIMILIIPELCLTNLQFRRTQSFKIQHAIPVSNFDA